MRSNRILKIAALSAGVVGAIAGWRMVCGNREAMQALSAERARNGILQAEVARDRIQLAALVSPRPPPTARLDEAKPAGSAAANSPHNTTGFMELMKDPKFQMRVAAQNRARNALEYGALYRKLNLSPDQIRKFEDNLETRDLASSDIGGALDAQGLQDGDPGLDQLGHAAGAKLEADFDAAQQELLGPDGYQQFQDYDRTLPIRDFVSNLIAGATTAGVALTTDQSEKLLAALSSIQLSGDQAVDLVDWDQADQQAAAILSDAQLQFFKSYAGEEAPSRFSAMTLDLAIKAMQADKIGSTTH